MNLRITNSPAWTMLENKDRKNPYEFLFPEGNCGSWRYEFDDTYGNLTAAQNNCKKAVLSCIVEEARYSNADALSMNNRMMGKAIGWCCLYCHTNDTDAHKRILIFMIENNLIPKDQFGNLVNIEFQRDWCTPPSTKPKAISLSDFIDLKTGKLK